MKLMLSAQHAKMIFFGTLLSTIGSMTYLMYQLAWFKSQGFSVVSISIFVGLIRGTGILSMLTAGRFSDRFSERKQIVLLECTAGLCSLVLYFMVPILHQHFYLFTIIAGARGYCIVQQVGARNKLLKLIGGGEKAMDHKYAIWMNTVTHGPVVFASLFALLIFSKLSLQQVILFDLVTFMINGVLLWRIPDSEPEARHVSESWLHFLGEFYRSAKIWALVDALLAVALAGLVMLMVRLAGNTPEHLTLFYCIYGASVWVGGKFAPVNPKPVHLVFWSVILGLSFIFLGGESLLQRLTAFTGVCFGYWALYQTISSQIQQAAPAQTSGAIHSARMFQMLIILVTGETLTGYLVEIVSFSAEIQIRAILCALVAIVGIYAVQNRTR